MRFPTALPATVLALTLSGCVHKPAVSPVATATVTPSTSATLENDPAHPGRTQGWVDTRLYFGLGPVEDESGTSLRRISETEWRAFLDREVTPRFPAGLSVVDVYGQWESKGASHPWRLKSKMLIVDYLDTQENRDKIEAIRVAWKQKTGDQSVMRVTEPVDVSF